MATYAMLKPREVLPKRDVSRPLVGRGSFHEWVRIEFSQGGLL